jgi:hypothetical protein
MSFKSFVVTCCGAPYALRFVAAPVRARRPLTPCGYAVLALAMTGILLAVVIAISPVGNGVDKALPLSSWFA